jgi:putative Mg2+ transporter-C (MgtC) family protein
MAVKSSSINAAGPPMDHGQLAVITRIGVALLIGGLIGFERTFHGRPAGFRTHSLVCVASALLMLVTVYQKRLDDRCAD